MRTIHDPTMPPDITELEASAMKLPAEDRERLATQLFRSLSDDPLDGAWDQEISKRIESLGNGTATYRSIEDALAIAHSKREPNYWKDRL